MTIEDEPVEAGFEEIPLDLSRVPSVQVGLDDAAGRYKGFIEIARASWGEGEESVLFRQHLAFVSFVNRASSLHKGVISSVRESNPHAAFTLLRAYLELVVLVRYLDLHQDYLAELEKPRPEGKRKRFKELFADAATEMPGVRMVYSTLSEMAHFGATALWHPFNIGGDDDLSLSFSTGPHWRHPDDARVALAMLRESDEAMALLLRRYDANHVAPLVKRHSEIQDLMKAFEDIGGTTTNADRGLGTLPPEIASEALEAGVVAWCEEHGAMEIADGVEPNELAQWVRDRAQHGSSPTAPAHVTSSYRVKPPKTRAEPPSG